MKSVVTFIELFQELNYNVSEKRLSSSGAISLSKREIFAINTSLNGLTEGTPVTTDQVAAITGCIGELCNSIIHEYECEERISYFLINLHLSDFMRHHFCDLIKSLWPILVKINSHVSDRVLFHRLIDDSLNNYPSWNWLSSTVLVKLAANEITNDLLKETLYSRENLVKFERMMHLNRDFTSLMNLIRLCVTLGLDTTFLQGLSTSYIKYIERINPNFKNLIQCSIKSNVDELIGSECYMQPIDRNLLHVWVNTKEQFACHHINLKCLESFRTFPNLIVKLKLMSATGPKTRSKNIAATAFLTSFAARLADGTQAKTLDIQLQVRDALHFNWLVQYLSALHKKRKLAINSVAEHADSHNQGRDTTLVDEKTRLQKFEARRNKNDSPVARHGRKDKITRSKRKKLSDEWELTSDIEFSFEESSTVHRKREQKIVYQQQIDEFVEKTKDRPSKEVELVAKASRQEIQKEEDTCHGDVHNPSDALQHQFDQNAKELSFSSNLFVSEGSSRSQPSDLSSSVLVPKERIDRVTKTQASTLIPDTETPVRTSTPVNAEFTEFPTITDKTSDTEGTLDVMNDALKLFSSNLLNKLKRVEFEVLHKRNDLQVQVDKEYKKIERMQRAKLKEIQEYCRNELDKIV